MHIRKAITHGVLTFLTVVLLFSITGCELTNPQKTAIISSSIKVAAATGVRSVIHNNPELADPFYAVADKLSLLASEDGITYEAISAELNALIVLNVESEKRQIVQLAFSESLGMMSLFLAQNTLPRFSPERRVMILSLATGIRLGLSLQTSANTLVQQTADASLFTLK